MLVKSVLLDPSVEPIIDAKSVEMVLEDEKVVHLLWKLLLLYSRKQDKEEMINLVFEVCWILDVLDDAFLLICWSFLVCMCLRA